MNAQPDLPSLHDASVSAEVIRSPLPEPARLRWQPLRVGLVDLYHYDCEEFHFRDGHLLLRGNNGTGKSKVLSLTLPFLFDAQLSSARIEPDGDRTKRMDWNLLMGHYERRLGYSWLELGRRDAQGTAHYLTLGCGLQAVAGRGRVDSWHFITEQRVGADLWLVSATHTALTRERLVEALGKHGQVFQTAREYRRAVDERVFRLGEARYDALMDTLIQLRQPQLSKRPDEGTLSSALSNALPPLAQGMLEEVAEAMNHLQTYREELAGIERLRDTLEEFGRQYQRYAQVQARRQARGVRQAESAVDTAARQMHRARRDFVVAETELQTLIERCAALDVALARSRAALEELRRDPSMRDAERLHTTENAAEHMSAEATRLEASCAETRRRAASEHAVSARRLAEAHQATGALQELARKVTEYAAIAGLASEHGPLAEVPGADRAATHFDTMAIDAVANVMRSAAERRREQIAQMQRRLHERAGAVALRLGEQTRCDERREAFEATRAVVRAAETALGQAARQLQEHWQRHIESLEHLRMEGSVELAGALADWVETLAGENPARAALRSAEQAVRQQIAESRARLGQERVALDARDELLAEEEMRLMAGGQTLPPASYTRDSQARADRAGAPLWQCIEFAPETSADECAALEAALEASGLLDAWVTPQGHLLHPDTHDQWLVPRAQQPHSLREKLLPQSAVAEALLGSIALGEEDSADAEVWIGTRGRFRVGPIQGAWSKPAAEYIGVAARAAARRRRLAEIGVLRAQLAELRAGLVQAQTVLDVKSQAVDRECAAPDEDALRRAQARFASEERQRREAQERLAETEARLQQAEARVRRAQAELEADAGDLRLPVDPQALVAVEQALGEYSLGAVALLAAARDAQRARREHRDQLEREVQAVSDERTREQELTAKRRSAEEMCARRDLLRKTIGATVAELERRLKTLEREVGTGESEVKVAQAARESANINRAKSEDGVEQYTAAHEHACGMRKQAVDSLQGFARTGLLAIALPEPEIPDPHATLWALDAALTLARRAEQNLSEVAAEDSDWSRVQGTISREFTALTTALSAQGHQAQMEQSDFGLIVQVIHQNRPERPDRLERWLAQEAEQRRNILTAQERELFENHLQAEVAASLQRLLQEGERRVTAINAELKKRPTSTGVYFKLEWQPLPEEEAGAPVGLSAARARLLRQVADAWSVQDRELIGEFLQQRIQTERARNEEGSFVEHLARALDYRLWHRFRVKRFQNGEWRTLSGPASSGERALGLTVPLFAAASSHYASVDWPHAPRLVLLDEVFAGIDGPARAHCMALIREFDLDFVMTSESEWGCYAALPGVSICHLLRQEGIDAVHVSRWTWDGRSKRRDDNPVRRWPDESRDAG